MRRRLGLRVAVLLVALLPSRALAVSVRDIVELSRAGLSDEVILALIEVDGTIFSLDAQQVAGMAAAGVSQRVLLAMLDTQRRDDAPVPGPDGSPPLAGGHAPPPYAGSRTIGGWWSTGFVPPPVVVQVPVLVPVWGRPRPHLSATGSAPAAAGFGRFINDGVRLAPPSAIAEQTRNFWHHRGDTAPRVGLRRQARVR